nr:hypothetical protein [Kibdelosporangium sp. MJ126-NF4]CEL18233.1 hypothetical protein [Kibdelosporangium sp. MJ126-NF4]CTQ90536.1 hypothetical protein [Kibdelosporangium sp. MJ126-NF4]
MCVCAAEAELSGTVLYQGRVEHPLHGLIHVLGYQNTVRNLAAGPNAMLLHLPGKDMSQANFIDTTGCPRILRNMVSALRPPRAHTIDWMSGPVAVASAVEVFEHDIYTVVLAEDPRAIPAALTRVPEARRVRISRELMEFYADRFPGYAIALCCFDNREAQQANPLLLWYTPHDTDLFRLPAIDCHTGGVPDLDADVATDHWVILGTDQAAEDWGTPVDYGLVEVKRKWGAAPRSPAVKGPTAGFLPARVIGRSFTGHHRNGDFTIAYDDVLRVNLSALQRI